MQSLSIPACRPRLTTVSGSPSLATRFTAFPRRRRLRQTVQLWQLEVHYQPIVALDSFEIRGVEALVRWRHPRHGLLLPRDFLCRATDAGMIEAIDLQVLSVACRQMAAWRASLPRPHGLSVSVNLDAASLTSPRLGGEVERILSSTGLEPEALKLEITERSRRPGCEAASETIHRLQRAGVRFRLDDFGTGYASLACLTTFPCEALKIDRSFTAGAAHDLVSRELVRSSVDLAHNLGMAAIVEGVETPAQLAVIAEFGCDLAQGYFFSRPLDPEEMQVLLVRSLRRA